MFPQSALICLLKGFLPKEIQVYPGLDGGFLFLFSDGFPSTRDLAGQSPEPVRVSFSPFSPRSSVLTEGLRVSGYDEDVAFLASKSLKPGTCRHFQRGWGKSLGDTFLLTNLGMKMFPRHPSEFFR